MNANAMMKSAMLWIIDNIVKLKCTFKSENSKITSKIIDMAKIMNAIKYMVLLSFSEKNLPVRPMSSKPQITPIIASSNSNRNFIGNFFGEYIFKFLGVILFIKAFITKHIYKFI